MARPKNISSHRKGKTLEEEYGIERAKEIRIRCSESKKGKKANFSQEDLIRRKQTMMGNKLAIGASPNKTAFKKCQTPWNKGLTKENSEIFKKQSEYYKSIGGINKGKHPYNYRGGSSKFIYSKEFNEELKEKIRKKYHYRCQQCFRHQDELRTKNNIHYKLRIHHIDYDKTNHTEKNLIPLCIPCHNQTNFSRDDWINYFKEMVNSL